MTLQISFDPNSIPLWTLSWYSLTQDYIFVDAGSYAVSQMTQMSGTLNMPPGSFYDSLATHFTFHFSPDHCGTDGNCIEVCADDRAFQSPGTISNCIFGTTLLRTSRLEKSQLMISPCFGSGALTASPTPVHRT